MELVSFESLVLSVPSRWFFDSSCSSVKHRTQFSLTDSFILMEQSCDSQNDRKKSVWAILSVWEFLIYNILISLPSPRPVFEKILCHLNFVFTVIRLPECLHVIFNLLYFCNLILMTIYFLQVPLNIKAQILVWLFSHQLHFGGIKLGKRRDSNSESHCSR